MTILSKLNEATPDEWDKAHKPTGLCPPTNPMDRQEGGSHYINYKIQPTEYIMANDLSFCQGNVVKYITRYKDKNGVEDLHKAKHYIEMLIAEYDKFEREERKYEEDNGIY